jgi:ribosomal protein S18 acetylase RimI-like enzyme
VRKRDVAAGNAERGPGAPDEHARCAPAVVIRAAAPGDAAADLVFDAARAAYCSAAGSEERARAILCRLWPMPGHSASFEHASVAELDGTPVGVVIAFPARQRYRLHLALLRKSLTHLRMRAWPRVVLALAQSIAATPRPPREAYYVATIAIAPQARRRGIASALARHAELRAARSGFRVIAAHTGSRHLTARRALERYGARAAKERSWGYVLYTKPADESPHPELGD